MWYSLSSSNKDSMSGYAAKNTFFLDLCKPAQLLFVHISLLHPDKEVLHVFLEFDIILMGKMTIMCALLPAGKAETLIKREIECVCTRKNFWSLKISSVQLSWVLVWYPKNCKTDIQIERLTVFWFQSLDSCKADLCICKMYPSQHLIYLLRLFIHKRGIIVWGGNPLISMFELIR